MESDDINSVLKSPIIKSRKKRRKRSSWATGVIKKAKKPVKNAEENENEQNEEPQKGEMLAIEPPSNGILVKSEEKTEEAMDTSVVEGPNLEPSGLEDSRVQVNNSIMQCVLFFERYSFWFHSSQTCLFNRITKISIQRIYRIGIAFKSGCRHLNIGWRRSYNMQ